MVIRAGSLFWLLWIIRWYMLSSVWLRSKTNTSVTAQNLEPVLQPSTWCLPPVLCPGVSLKHKCRLRGLPMRLPYSPSSNVDWVQLKIAVSSEFSCVCRCPDFLLLYMDTFFVYMCEGRRQEGRWKERKRKEGGVEEEGKGNCVRSWMC